MVRMGAGTVNSFIDLLWWGLAIAYFAFVVVLVRRVGR